VRGGSSNHHRQLHLPVDLRAAARNDHVVVRAGQRARRLEENDRLPRDLHAAFGGMIAEIQPDADNLARAANRRTEPDAGIETWRAAGLLPGPAGQSLQTVVPEKRFVVIGAEAGRIDARAIGELQTGTLPPGLAEANQLHRKLL